MAVLWKNGPAVTVVPGTRVVMLISARAERLAIYMNSLELTLATVGRSTYSRKARTGVDVRANNDGIVISRKWVHCALADGQRPHSTTAADDVEFALDAGREVALYDAR